MAQSLEQAASKGTAGTALGIGIGALGLELLRGGFGGLFGRGLLGREGEGYGYEHGHGCCGPCCTGPVGPSAWEVSKKECKDFLEATCNTYDVRIAGMNDRFYDRQYTDLGFFKLEKQIQNDRFQDYVYNRNKTDELQNEICCLKGKISAMEAVRPYQDKIIQLEIADARKDARCELKWHTRNMITGEVVLPSTPTVTGFPSVFSTALPVEPL